MARSYSEKFLLALQKADSTSLGVKLGRLCVEANLPSAYVARALEVSRVTMYKWFRGQGIREDKRRTVEVFIDLVSEDMKQGLLPATTMFSAKLYIENMIGEKI